jgi:hypothetical protein
MGCAKDNPGLEGHVPSSREFSIDVVFARLRGGGCKYTAVPGFLSICTVI